MKIPTSKEYNRIIQFSMEVQEKDVEKAQLKCKEFFNSCKLEACSLKTGVFIINDFE